MTILIVEPGKVPTSRKIEGTLESMQSIVGGLIQAIYPFDEPIALICNEEAKLTDMPPNRALRYEDGRIYDIICGTFFLCAAPPDSENFKSLNEEQMERYTKRFQHPEVFLRVNGEIVVVPV